MAGWLAIQTSLAVSVLSLPVFPCTIIRAFESFPRVCPRRCAELSVVCCVAALLPAHGATGAVGAMGPIGPQGITGKLSASFPSLPRSFSFARSLCCKLRCSAHRLTWQASLGRRVRKARRASRVSLLCLCPSYNSSCFATFQVQREQLGHRVFLARVVSLLVL